MIPSIKQLLRSGKTTIGSWMQLPHPSVAEIMAHGEFDWVAVDLEHGAVSCERLADLFRAFESKGTAPFVRVAQAASKDIKQALDAGCRGLIVPMIETREQIEAVIAWAQYPPDGTRGVGYSRANVFGKEFPGYFSEINRSLTIVAQIESIQAIENLESILSVPGIDAVMVGPYDLSASMGITGQFEHPKFHQAMAVYEATARRAHVPLGLHIVQPDCAALHKKIQDGYQFIAYGIDAVFLYRNAVNPLAINAKNN